MRRIKFMLKNIRRIFSIFPRNHVRNYIFLGLISSLLFVAEYLSPLIQKKLIDEAIETKILFNDYFSYLIIIYAIYFGLIFLISFLTNLVGFKINASLFMYFTEKVLLLRKSIINRKGTGYYYDILSNDTDRASTLINLTPFNLIFSSIQMIMILVILWKWSIVISILFLCSFTISIITSVVASLINQKNMGHLRENASSLSKETINNISNNFSLKTNLKVREAINRILEYFDKSVFYMKKLVIVQEFSELILTFLKIAPFLMVIIYSLYLIINSQITYGTMLAIISYYQLLYNPIKHFSSLMYSITRTEVSISRLLYIVDEVNARNKYNYLNKELLLQNIETFSFSKLNFSYESDSNLKNYEDINFVIEKGNNVGIVGLSGEGKSTLLKLIYREESAKKGEICINDINILNIPELNYLSKINIYSQELEIFNDDLIYNLTLGRNLINLDTRNQLYSELKNKIDIVLRNINSVIENSNLNKQTKYKKILAIINDSEFESLLDLYDMKLDPSFIVENSINSYLEFWEKINIDKLLEELTMTEFDRKYIDSNKVNEVINSLELSYMKDRMLGENGSFVSGGERQKIVFGRFLLKNNFDLYILDEPFTSMDAITEKTVLDAAKKFLKNRTGIVISHKFNILLELTDNFIVLENGKISERGTHSQLIENGGLYKKIFEHYRDQKLPFTKE